MAFTVVELFAGCGGMTLGFHQAGGFEHAACNECDAAACATLRKNLDVPVRECKIEVLKGVPRADVLVGGPPCQGFSSAAGNLERRKKNPKNELWQQYVRCLKRVKPKMFVLENVPLFLQSSHFMAFREYVGTLGYKVAARVLNAADYGVPQKRRRAIVMGCLHERPPLPPRTHVRTVKRGFLSKQLKPWVTVRDAIGDLPLKPNNKNWHVALSLSAKRLKRYACIPPGGDRRDVPDELLETRWRKLKHNKWTRLLGRFVYDEPATTLVTIFHMDNCGIAHLHPEAHRPITHREAARLQGFPDDFDFVGSIHQVARQIGNAVPPPLARAIARSVFECLNNR